MGQAHILKMLYFPDDFEDGYHRVVQAYRIVGVIAEDGERGHSRERLTDLLLALSGLSSAVWQQFKSALR
jgi:hypothetical protein